MRLATALYSHKTETSKQKRPEKTMDLQTKITLLKLILNTMVQQSVLISLEITRTDRLPFKFFDR